jgi:predicted adenine nucleotide alpha hydrolase (AANH) superfamily ATPase
MTNMPRVYFKSNWDLMEEYEREKRERERFIRRNTIQFRENSKKEILKTIKKLYKRIKEIKDGRK